MADKRKAPVRDPGRDQAHYAGGYGSGFGGVGYRGGDEGRYGERDYARAYGRGYEQDYDECGRPGPSGPHYRGGEGPHRGRGPKGYVRSDARIREDVCEALADDPYLDASNVELHVSDGEITLSGIVPDRHARRRAEDCIDRIAGVRHVRNDLRVG